MDDHNHAHSRHGLQFALAVTGGYMVVELVGGFLTGSLALLSDAGHMLSDVASLMLALIAFRFAARPATGKNTYGFHRAEILAAFVNGVVLVVVAIAVFLEAVGRFRVVPEVKSLPMLIVATLGLVVNISSAVMLHSARGESLNVQGAFVHVIADALGSLGAIAAGVVMLTTGWYLADPIISIVIGILILLGAWNVLKEAIHILMEGTPRHIDAQALQTAVLQVPGVLALHDLHVWTVTSGFEALSAHAVINPSCTLEEAEAILKRVRILLKDRFGIEHSTIQIERGTEFKEARFIR